MAYTLAAAIAVTAIRYTIAIKRGESVRVLYEIPAAALAGLLAGLWLGLAARMAMRVVAFFASAPPRISVSGSIEVVLVFAAMGGGIAILYPGLFRHALGRNGIWFGLLLFFGSWYPLAQAGAQLLGYKPDPLKLMLVSGVVVATMFIPYTLLLQKLMVPLCRRFVAETSPA